MRILFMAQHYAPEQVGGALLATEMASELVRQGHWVEFVTCVPNHPFGRVFPGYRNGLLQRQYMDGVEVLRVWSYISPKKTILRRLFNYGSFSVASFYGGLSAGHPDVILSYSPPLSLGLTAWLLSRLWGVPWILRVEDLYPQAAISAGVLRNRALIHSFEKLERFLYRQATHISLISSSFQRNLIRNGVPADKLSVVAVWADPEQIRPLDKENSFRREHGLQGKFVVLYAGNFGYSSALEDVLQAADILRKHTAIQFVLIGEGIKKGELETYVRQHKLNNVLFLPYQPRQCYAEVLAAADVGLVTINVKSAESSMPSKVFNVMSSSRPVLAVAPKQSDLATLLETCACGVSVSPGDPQALIQALNRLQVDPTWAEELGHNGRQALIETYSRPKIIQAYVKILEQVIAGKSSPSS